MKKRILSHFLVLALVFQLLFVGGIHPLSTGAVGSESPFPGDDFSNRLAGLLSDHPLEDAFSSLIFDVEQNTLQQDGKEPVSLDAYDVNFADVSAATPAFPIVPVLEAMGIDAKIDSETGDLLTYEDGEEERIPLEDPPPSNSDGNDSGDAGSVTMGTARPAQTERPSLQSNAGFITPEQAYELFNCEAEYMDGKIIVSRPFQSMRLILETTAGQSLSNSYDAQTLTDGNGYYVLQFNREDAAKSAYETYQNDAGIRYVVPDTVVSASALSDRTGAATVQSDRYKKYLKDNGKTTPMTVAVVDTGADVAHPFLAGRLLPGYNFDAGTSNVKDGHGHGTHVSGIVADNTPNTVKILPVKALNDNGQATNLVIAQSIDYAVSKKVNVINLSLGGPCAGKNCPIEKSILAAIAQGITVVVAAGNESLNTMDFCPSNVGSSIVVASSSGFGFSVSSFSNHGSTVDITAPGEAIESSVPGGGYDSMSGTSMAAPFVAAAAAMLLTENPALTPKQVESKLCSSLSTDMLVKGKDIHTGTGLLNFGLFFGDNSPVTYISSSLSSVDMLVFGYAAQRMAVISTNTSDNSIASNRSFTVKNSNSKVASFDGRYIKALSAGTTKITLTLSGGASAVITVKVTKREVWLDYAAKSYAGGSGTKSSPYLIATPQHLARFALAVRNGNNFSGKYLKLTADINLAGKEWITATSADTGIWDADFSGVFDGNNHVIKNMKVFNESVAKDWGENQNENESWYQNNTGFLGAVQNCEIKNLGLVNAYSSAEWGGLLARDVSQGSKISSCYTTGFSGGGGLFDFVHNYDIEIRNCFSSATVRFGGIATEFHASSMGTVRIINSYFCGEVLGSSTVDESGVFSYGLGRSSRSAHQKNQGIYNCFAASVGLDGNGFVTRKGYGIVSKCYYLSDNPAGIGSDQTPTLTSLKAKPLSFFKTKGSYTTQSNWNSAYPWDFTNVWAIDPKINNGLPYLKKLPPPPAPTPAATGTWLDHAASNFAGGRGTQKSPFLIETPQQLARISKVFRYGGGKNFYFKLTKNIDLAGHDWFPIGGGDDLHQRAEKEDTDYLYFFPENLRYSFYAHIDGNNKTISNMHIRSEGDLVGFISLLQGGSVENLTLKNAEVSGRNYVGTVTGFSYLQSKLYNCTTSGSVTARRWTGSITGINHVSAWIAGANASAAVGANEKAGGITGLNHGVIEQSSFTGSLHCMLQPGGLVSENYGKIRNSFSLGTAPLVGNLDLNADPISGTVPYYGDVYRSYSVGVDSYQFDDCFGSEKNIPKTVTSEQLKEQSTFSGWDFTKVWQISADKNSGYPSLRLPTAVPASLPATRWENYAAKSYAGGDGTAENPYLIATGAQLARVIVLERTNPKAFGAKYYRLIRNINLGAHLWCSVDQGGYSPETMYFDGNNKTISNMTTENGAGLFEFGLQKGYIKNLHLKNVKGFTKAGLIYSNNGGTITGCSVSGEVSTTPYDNNAVGAICAYNSGTIQKCSSSATVTGFFNVGGIAGYSTGTVSNCYTTGSIFGINSAGSIVSNNSGGKIRNCYATGRLTGISRGFEEGSSSYCDKETLGLWFGKTTAQMKTQSTYKSWDFSGVWSMSPTENGGYPALRPPVSYTIAYVLNGGENASNAEFDYISGSVCRLQIPIRKGYFFVGWFKTSDFTGNAVTKILKTYVGNKTYYAKWVKCPDVTAITGNPADLTIWQSASLKATVPASGGYKVPVTWSSSDTSVAVVDKTSGLVTGKGAGVVKITASAGGKTKSVTLTVHQYVTLRIGKDKALRNGLITQIDGQKTKPFKLSGKTMVPVRFIAEQLGGTVNYVSDDQPIVLTYGNRRVELKLGSNRMSIIIGTKTTTVALEVAAQKKNGRTYIPLRAIGQALGFTIYYDAKTEIVVVNNPGMSTALRNTRIAEGKKFIK